MPRFLLCFAVVAASSIGVVLWGNASGDLTPGFLTGFSTAIVALVIVGVEAIVFAIVCARRRSLSEWLAGYAGVVLGCAPSVALADYFTAVNCPGGPGGHYNVLMSEAPCPSLPTLIDSVGNAESGALVAGVGAGVIFLVIGAIAWVIGARARVGMEDAFPVDPVPRTFGRWRVAVTDPIFRAGTDVDVRMVGRKVHVASKAFTRVLAAPRATVGDDARTLRIVSDQQTAELLPLDGQNPRVIAAEINAGPTRPPELAAVGDIGSRLAR